jgi:hypothetical protein
MNNIETGYRPTQESPRMDLGKLEKLVEPLSLADSVLARTSYRSPTLADFISLASAVEK